MSEKISKLSLKSIKALPKRGCVSAASPTLVLATVYGVAAKQDIAQTNTGEADRFRGDFEAVVVNGEAHTVYTSQSFFPIDAITDTLSEALEATGTPVEFAFRIGVEFTDKNKAGYTYTVESLRHLSSADPLAQLRGDMLHKLGLTDAKPPKASKK